MVARKVLGVYVSCNLVPVAGAQACIAGEGVLSGTVLVLSLDRYFHAHTAVLICEFGMDREGQRLGERTSDALYSHVPHSRPCWGRCEGR